MAKAATQDTEDAGAGAEAPKKEFAPVICLSTSLSTAGTRLVEASGYFDALNHLDALAQYDAVRPRSKLADLRKTIKEISSDLDTYENTLGYAPCVVATTPDIQEILDEAEALAVAVIEFNEGKRDKPIGTPLLAKILRIRAALAAGAP